MDEFKHERPSSLNYGNAAKELKDLTVMLRRLSMRVVTVNGKPKE